MTRAKNAKGSSKPAEATASKPSRKRGAKQEVEPSTRNGAEVVAPPVVPWHHVSRPQLAACMGVHEDTVSDYTRQGMPVHVKGGHGHESVYDLIACLAWWRQTQGMDAKEAAQARLYDANAAKAELELKTRQGAVVPVAAVVEAGQAISKALSAKLQVLPVQLRHRGIIQREQEGGVAAVVRELLTDVSAWKTVADAMAGAS